jgi:hypothetical protein
METKRHQSGVELGIPGPGRLLQTVQGFPQPQDFVLSSLDDETGGLRDVDFFLELAVEERCDNPIRGNSVLSPKPLHLVIKR